MRWIRDIARLERIISKGHLSKDDRMTAISGLNYVVPPRPSHYFRYIPSKLSKEGSFATAEKIVNVDFEVIKSMGFNTLRITTDRYGFEGYYHKYMDLCIKYAIKYGLQLIPILPLKAIGIEGNPTIGEMKARLESTVVPYIDEKTIYLWDLVNEPILTTQEDLDILRTLATHLKLTDTNHPITIGIDKFDLFQYLEDVMDTLSWHFYQFSTWETEDPYSRLVTEINQLKTYGKPVLIEEFGFPTHRYFPSNQGNTPYKCPFIIFTTRQTEKLQRNYFANILYIIKDSNIAGYTFWTFRDDSEGGFGILRYDDSLKPVAEVLP